MAVSNEPVLLLPVKVIMIILVSFPRLEKLIFGVIWSL